MGIIKLLIAVAIGFILYIVFFKNKRKDEADAISQQGLNSPFDKHGYDKYGYDKYGRSLDGYDASGYDMYGRDINGYDINGYDVNGYDINGYDINGHSQYDQQYDQDNSGY